MYQTIEHHYDPVELQRWLAYDREGHGYPKSRHLKYCKFDTGEISCERAQYFAEAWLCRYYHQLGCKVFHERYWLHNLSYRGKQTYSNDRLIEILGTKLSRLVEAEANKLKKFGNPDVIAYNPETRDLFMFEVKLWKPNGYQDRLKPHQIQSIGLLARLLPHATVSVVEMKPQVGGDRPI